MKSSALHWSILREYDIRGKINKTLFKEDARSIGKAFGTMVIRDRGRTVCVGYDGRLTSPELESQLIEGLTSTGVTVIRIGMCPTPMVYFASKVLDTSGAIMITGSHNPADYNGFKMVMNNQPFFGNQIKKLSEIVSKQDYITGYGIAVWSSLNEEYVKRITSDYSGQRPLKIAWDAGNGVVGPFMHGISHFINGEHIFLNDQIDGTFPNHHPDPTEPENLEELIAVVKEQGCDMGIAFDGDGDRIGIVDNQGHIIWGDQIMMILSRELLKHNPGAKIIADVKSSNALFQDIEAHGGKAIMWQTGHSLIKKKILSSGALLAGEMSGHIFFNDRYYGYDDALYAAIRFASLISNKNIDLATILEELPPTVNTPELRFECDDSKKFEIVESIKSRLCKQGVIFNDIDGVRVSTENGWWLLRASNTQNVLVARCEADNDENLTKLKKSMIYQLKQSGYLVA